MNRCEVISTVMQLVTDELVVCNIGHPCQELFSVRDRPGNFYMLGSMGMASSIGLGLALSVKQKVVVLEGDGSLLMNLGSLATISANGPDNYFLLIIDNGAYGSTGFQETFTAQGIDLAGTARACKIPNIREVSNLRQLEAAATAALASDRGPWCIVAKTSPERPRDLQPIPLGAAEIKRRFVRHIHGTSD